MSASLWLRAYAGAVGIALMGLGAAGFFLLPGQGLAGSLFQALVGALFVYTGLGQRDPVVARRFVGGQGVLLLLGAGAIVCFGLLLGDGAGVLGPVQASCLTVGLLNVLVARQAEPGVLLAAVSATGATGRAAIAALIVRVRRRRRQVASSKTPRRARRGIAEGSNPGVTRASGGARVETPARRGRHPAERPGEEAPPGVARRGPRGPGARRAFCA